MRACVRASKPLCIQKNNQMKCWTGVSDNFSTSVLQKTVLAPTGGISPEEIYSFIQQTERRWVQGLVGIASDQLNQAKTDASSILL